MNSACEPALNIDQGFWTPCLPKQWIAVPAGVQFACRFIVRSQSSFTDSYHRFASLYGSTSVVSSFIAAIDVVKWANPAQTHHPGLGNIELPNSTRLRGIRIHLE